MSRIRHAVLGVIASFLLMSCGGGDGAPLDPSGTPPTRAEAQLSFLRLAPGASLTGDSVSFWAVRGKNREVSMFYRPKPGRTDSVRFLSFKVSDKALLRKPDGTSFVFGDSIRITIRVRDLSRIITEYAPSGLVFNPAEPAELRLDFENADDDYDRDGRVTRSDSLLVPTFAIWKQEFAGQPWMKLSSRVEVSNDLQEIEAQILSFTNHAIAY